MLDFDGNERASVHLRDSDLNLLHILLQQLQRNDLRPEIRKAVTDAFFATIERRRGDWQRDLDELNKELSVLNVAIEQQRKLWQAQPKKFSKEEQDAGLDDAAKRIFVQLDRWQAEHREYSYYAQTMNNLLSLSTELFAPAKLKIREIIPKESMGERNTIHQLQNYVVGLAPNGFVLNGDGSLDFEKSFLRLDYFALLHGVTVRNNVQRGLTNRPIDLIATRLKRELVLPLIGERAGAGDIDEDVIWISAGADRQALLLSRTDASGRLSLRYLPVSNLRQDAAGKLQFNLIDWQAGLPLQMFEDPKLAVPDANRAAWLSQWHTDVEWLEALHQTKYSNGFIGLHEELARHPNERLSTNDPALSADEKVMRTYARRKRELVEADMLIVARDHWNFDVRGFNPGGNHGSFFRLSTHSIFMIAGGANTRIPQAFTIDAPYDSLSFMPTLLALTGDLRDDNSPVPKLWDKGFRHFPGRVVKELLPNGPDKKNISANGVNAAP
jgi:hypothetical protein